MRHSLQCARISFNCGGLVAAGGCRSWLRFASSENARLASFSASRSALRHADHLAVEFHLFAHVPVERARHGFSSRPGRARSAGRRAADSRCRWRPLCLRRRRARAPAASGPAAESRERCAAPDCGWRARTRSRISRRIAVSSSVGHAVTFLRRPRCLAPGRRDLRLQTAARREFADHRGADTGLAAFTMSRRKRLTTFS